MLPTTLALAFATLLAPDPNAEPGHARLQLDTVAVDAVFAAYDRNDGPGCALGVIRDGELVYARGYGMANLEHDVPLGSRTVLRIGSTSKQFTAACAVLAEQQGVLSLDDDIRKHLPEMPDYGETITIRHLLNHTSGIRDYLVLMSLAGYTDDDYYTNADVYRMIARQETLNFAPGSRHLYSNSGYFLISVIIEGATGKTLSKFADEHLFAPLGMTSSHFHDDYMRVVKGRADGYTRGADGRWRIHNTNLEMCGDGGVFTTVEDMLRWDANFYEPKLGGRALVDALQTRGVLDDGTVLDYALGLMVGDHRGLPLVSHGGAFVGFRAEMLRFPDEQVSIVCFANLDAINPTALALQVADVVLEGRFRDTRAAAAAAPAAVKLETAVAPAFVEVPPDELARFAGRYVGEVNGEMLEIVPDGQGLRVRMGPRAIVVRPVAAMELRGVDSNASLRFEPSVREGFWRGVLEIDGDTLPFGEYIEWDTGSMTIDEYAGDYDCRELDARWVLRAVDGKLELAIGAAGLGPLTVVALDVLQGPVGLLAFERDPFQSVSGFRLNAGRVRGLRFERSTR